MEPAAYAAGWRSRASSESLAQQGEALFRATRLQRLSLRRRAPCTRRRSSGFTAGSCICWTARRCVADRRYIRDSILLPKKQIVAGYPPVMPSFAGQLGEDDLMKLIAYIKSLSPGTR